MDRGGERRSTLPGYNRTRDMSYRSNVYGTDRPVVPSYMPPREQRSLPPQAATPQTLPPQPYDRRAPPYRGNSYTHPYPRTSGSVPPLQSGPIPSLGNGPTPRDYVASSYVRPPSHHTQTRHSHTKGTSSSGTAGSTTFPHPPVNVYKTFTFPDVDDKPVRLEEDLRALQHIGAVYSREQRELLMELTMTEWELEKETLNAQAAEQMFERLGGSTQIAQLTYQNLPSSSRTYLANGQTRARNDVGTVVTGLANLSTDSIHATNSSSKSAVVSYSPFNESTAGSSTNFNTVSKMDIDPVKLE